MPIDQWHHNLLDYARRAERTCETCLCGETNKTKWLTRFVANKLVLNVSDTWRRRHTHKRAHTTLIDHNQIGTASLHSISNRFRAQDIDIYRRSWATPTQSQKVNDTLIGPRMTSQSHWQLFCILAKDMRQVNARARARPRSDWLNFIIRNEKYNYSQNELLAVRQKKVKFCRCRFRRRK